MAVRTRSVKTRAVSHVKDLHPDPQNARVHSPRNVGTIVSALHEVGAARSIVIDETGRVLAGNATLEAAGEAGIHRVQVVDADGETLIAVRRSGLTKQQKARLALFDNRAAELAEGWDVEVLKALQMDDVSLDGLWGPDELADLYAESVTAREGRTDPDAVPAERATDIKPGDIFELGTHRLLCGDSTTAVDVGRVLGSCTPFLCVTDPPYGVNYDPKWRNEAAAKGQLAYAARRVGEVANDDRADWSAAWALTPSDVIYSWHPPGATSLVHAHALQVSGFVLRMQIIWAKSNFPIGRGDYHVRHEPCWYAVRKGKVARRTNDRTQTTLWEINLDKNVGGGHSTQKPVECMARPIRNHDAAEVYEPFSGSGTTIIACEQLQRRCFAIEIEPRYVQVAIDRWEAFSGVTAKKVGDAPRLRKDGRSGPRKGSTRGR